MSDDIYLLFYPSGEQTIIECSIVDFSQKNPKISCTARVKIPFIPLNIEAIETTLLGFIKTILFI